MNQEILRLIKLEKDTLGSNFIEQSAVYYAKCNPDFGLTEEEFLTVRMLVSNGEGLIQRHLYAGTEPTELETELCLYLDKAIAKIPVEDTTDVVHRIVNQNYFNPSQIGKVVVFPAYLTASKEYIGIEGPVEYNIQLSGRTQARSLYRVYEITPAMPEWQVEFPRNTKFYVKDILKTEEKTYVYLLECPKYNLPVELLTTNVSEFFHAIKAIDIEEAVRKGLKPQIKFMKSVDGERINACCAPDGQVYLSPTFAQGVWSMCYAALYLADGLIMEKEAEINGSSIKTLYEEIVKHDCKCPECLYIKGVYEAKDWDYIVEKAIAYRRNWNLEADDEEMSQLDMYDPFVGRVGSLYKSAIGTVLLHELTHFFNNHFGDEQTPRRDKEQNADDVAFDAVLQIENRVERKAAVLGILSVYLLGFFNNPQLRPTDNYYMEDIRLFRQFGKIVELKREASIIVANVLAKWLKDEHNIIVEVVYGQEDDAISTIRDIISKM